jgi:hypothetical protein
VCDECLRSKKEFRLMTKTEAVKHYRLKPADLEELECEEKRNPKYRSAAPMRLYLRSDLRHLANEVHGSKDARLALQSKLEDRKAKMRRNKEASKQQRREELIQELAKHGLELRQDSSLCAAYIEKGKTVQGQKLVLLDGRTMTLDQVAWVMKQHAVLYGELNFEHRFNQWLHNDGFQRCRDAQMSVREAREEMKEDLWTAYTKGKANEFVFGI